MSRCLVVPQHPQSSWPESTHPPSEVRVGSHGEGAAQATWAALGAAPRASLARRCWWGGCLPPIRTKLLIGEG